MENKTVENLKDLNITLEKIIFVEKEIERELLKCIDCDWDCEVLTANKNLAIVECQNLICNKRHLVQIGSFR